MSDQNLVKIGALFKGSVTPAKLKEDPPYTAIKPKVLLKIFGCKNDGATNQSVSKIK